MPLMWDAARQEPFLQLSQPHLQHIRLIPIRSDVDHQLVKLLGDRNVNDPLRGEAYPYTLDIAAEYVRKVTPLSVELCDAIKKQLFPEDVSRTLPFAQGQCPTFPGCPFRLIFDTNSQTVIGQIDVIYRPNTVERKCALGYALLPEWQGKGIMSAALGCVLEGWILQYMDTTLVGAWCERNNIGSIRALQKNGFEEILAAEIEWPEEKGGGLRQVIRLERKPAICLHARRS